MQDTTRGERWWLLRRRLGLRPPGAAAALNVSHRTYQQWERDIGDVPEPDIAIIEPWEHCALLRRRTGMTEKRLAQLLGVPSQKVNLMERGRKSFDRLRDFWSV